MINEIIDKRVVTCPVCKTQFYSKSRRKYCSNKCANRGAYLLKKERLRKKKLKAKREQRKKQQQEKLKKVITREGRTELNKFMRDHFCYECADYKYCKKKVCKYEKELIG